MDYYEIEPVDTLFFRDGRSYNMGETQNDVKSVFPPSPFTMAGAFRAALSRKMGWESGPWEQEIIDKLGDRMNLGPLHFFGPYLQANGDMIFPVPRNVLAQKMGEDKWINYRKLIPGNEIQSDQGSIRYPILDNDLERMKNINGFVKGLDLQKILWENDISGIQPFSADNVWKHEFNVGIQRKDDELTVKDGMLFSRSFVRLGEGLKGSKQPDIKIVSGIKGADECLEGPMMIGGESKAAFVKKIKNIDLPKPPESAETLSNFTAVLITPARIDELRSGEGIKGLPDHVELISICADRPQMIGGWDFKEGPLPLKPYIKAGSVLFLRSDEGINPDDWNGRFIGNKTEFGFGQILIGKW